MTQQKQKMSWGNNHELDWVTILETISENEADSVKQRQKYPFETVKRNYK